MDREFVSRISSLLTSNGFFDFRFVKGRRHPRVEIAHQGRLIQHVFPSSGSDQRGVLNSLALLRRQLNIVRPAGKKSVSRERHDSRRKKPVRLGLVAPVFDPVERHDWHEELARLIARNRGNLG